MIVGCTRHGNVFCFLADVEKSCWNFSSWSRLVFLMSALGNGGLSHLISSTYRSNLAIKLQANHIDEKAQVSSQRLLKTRAAESPTGFHRDICFLHTSVRIRCVLLRYCIDSHFAYLLWCHWDSCVFGHAPKDPRLAASQQQTTALPPFSIISFGFTAKTSGVEDPAQMNISPQFSKGILFPPRPIQLL